MGAVWDFITVYSWSICALFLAAFLILIGASVSRNKSGDMEDSDAWWMGVLTGLLGVGFLFGGIASSIATFESQSLNDKEITAVMSEGGCVSQALRLSLQEADIPLSRDDLDRIRESCQEQKEKAEEEARTQDILDQQRSVADLKDSKKTEGE